jgi:hypothetical protein
MRSSFQHKHSRTTEMDVAVLTVVLSSSFTEQNIRLGRLYYGAAAAVAFILWGFCHVVVRFDAFLGDS